MAAARLTLVPARAEALAMLVRALIKLLESWPEACSSAWRASRTFCSSTPFLTTSGLASACEIMITLI